MQRPKQRGMTLLEVLIAMLVMSVGMLGIAGLQAAVNKYQTGSRVRGKMAPLLSDIAERVRMNPTQAGDNVITGVASTSAYGLSTSWSDQITDPSAPSKNCETGTVTCSAAERAAYDMAIWRQRVRAAMPTGSALLSGNRATGFQVTFMWMDKDQTDKGGASTSTLASAATCSTAAETANSNRLSQQNCCPAAASAPAGVRCTNFTFVP
ncbi:type IV pilus modification protein PilV [Xylophilus rhododendri]|uniref:Type IV pilus modification protein PilV n=1 Tax=Xylophilus rhododendri TaxID=2697032 RepID=A0A857JA53_9BURK|nr:type IV pilus modification protein PilV [Xylophilus rhododendri]QHJ00787.1 type IV pilus modification protein PilV [Xylophilus rhododendri]